MSQRNPGDGQKGFAVGRGLLAAAETLNFSSAPQNRTMRGGENQDRGSQLPQRSGGSSQNTMKLFASLGLSPADLDALAQIPKEDISVETLPDILMQLKRRKGGGGMAGVPSMGMSQQRAPQPSSAADFGYGSMTSVSSSAAHRYDLDYNTRERPAYSELSCDSYGGMGMTSSSESVLMQTTIGSPSQGKVQDFLGVTPTMFPHICSLCDFDVHSNMEWNKHTSCLRHAENRRQLLKMYPDWDPGMDPGMASARSGNPRMANTPNLGPGLLGQAPRGGGQQSGRMDSDWGGNAGNNRSLHGQVERSMVVVAVYDMKPLNNKTLFALAEPFGILRENLVLKNKAFLEMDTHQQALDMVQYYKQNPATMRNQPVHFYLSKDLAVIRKDGPPPGAGSGSYVVYFTNVPREEEKKMDLLTIAGRFGTVVKHLFLISEAFIQLSSPEDAESLVKYYTLNTLTIEGKPIRLNICTKYKTLIGQGVRGLDRETHSGVKGAGSGSQVVFFSKLPREEEKKMELLTIAGNFGTVEKHLFLINEAFVQLGSPEEAEMMVKYYTKNPLAIQGHRIRINMCVKYKTLNTDKNKDKDNQRSKKTFTSSNNSPGNRRSSSPGNRSSNRNRRSSSPGNRSSNRNRRSPSPRNRSSNRNRRSSSRNRRSSSPGNRSSSKLSSKSSSRRQEQKKREETKSSVERGVKKREETKSSADKEEKKREETKSSADKEEKKREETKSSADKEEERKEETKSGHEEQGEEEKQECEEEQEVELQNPEEAQQHADGDPVTTATNREGDRAEAQEKESVLEAGPSEKAENVDGGDKTSTNPEDSQMNEEEIPEDMATMEDFPGSMDDFVTLDELMDEDVEANKSHSQRPTDDRDRDRDSKKRYSRSTSSPHTDEPPTKKRREEKTPAKDKKDDEGKGQEEELKSEVEMKEEESTEEQKEVNADSDSDSEQLSSDVVKQAEVSTSLSQQNHSMDYGENQTPTAEQTDATTPIPADATTPEQTDATTSMPADATTPEQTDATTPIPADATTPIPADATTPEQTDATTSMPADATTPEQTDAATPVQAVATAPVENDATTPVHTKPAPASLPLAPYDENNPVGLEFVKMGYYCRVCLLFYSNEETAKKIHCSSRSHYDKLKKHLEKKKKGKKTE